MLLTVEMVPKSAWFKNLRSELTRAQWDKVRKGCYRKAGFKCEVCGGKGRRHPVECHEVWEYNDEACTQTLIGLVALCPDCHQVKHMGLAEINGKKEEATRHLGKVNGWTKEDASLYVEAAFEQYYKRSEKEWKIDISYIKSYL